MVDDMCVRCGGSEAERLSRDDISTGAGGSDLARATTLAHLIVEIYGMGSETTGLRQFRNPRDGKRIEGISPAQEEEIDRQITALIKEAQDRAAKILRENRDQLTTLRDLLIDKKTLDAKTIGEMLAKPESKKAKKKGEGD